MPLLALPAIPPIFAALGEAALDIGPPVVAAVGIDQAPKHSREADEGA